jgi:hypothetical protein
MCAEVSTDPGAHCRPAAAGRQVAAAGRQVAVAGLGATVVRVLHQEGLDHYGVAMNDPEGNGFDIS